jgi:capsid protein
MSQRPSRDFAMVNQENIIDVVVLRIFERHLKSAITFGVYDLDIKRLDEFVDAARFRGKRFPFTDELREVQALVLKLDAKIITPQQAQDLLPDGMDIEDIIAQWAEWNERLEAYGMPTEEAPTQVRENEDEQLPPEAGGGAGAAPATTKPAKAKGSVTAGMQKNNSKSKRSRAIISPQVLAMLEDTRNGH